MWDTAVSADEGERTMGALPGAEHTSVIAASVVSQNGACCRRALHRTAAATSNARPLGGAADRLLASTSPVGPG